MIVAFPKNTLTEEQKENLTKKGYTVVECDEPEKIRVIVPDANIDANDYFMAALFACTVRNPISNPEHFVNELYKRLNKNQ